jgi:hypothetical protein
LNETQRAGVAEKLANMPQGARTDIEHSANLQKVSIPQAAMWMACHTQEEIAQAVGVDQSEASRETKELCNLETLPKSIKLAALYSAPVENALKANTPTLCRGAAICCLVALEVGGENLPVFGRIVGDVLEQLPRLYVEVLADRIDDMDIETRHGIIRPGEQRFIGDTRILPDFR